MNGGVDALSPQVVPLELCVNSIILPKNVIAIIHMIARFMAQSFACAKISGKLPYLMVTLMRLPSLNTRSAILILLLGWLSL